MYNHPTHKNNLTKWPAMTTQILNLSSQLHVRRIAKTDIVNKSWEKGQLAETQRKMTTHIITHRASSWDPQILICISSKCICSNHPCFTGNFQNEEVNFGNFHNLFNCLFMLPKRADAVLEWGCVYHKTKVLINISGPVLKENYQLLMETLCRCLSGHDTHSKPSGNIYALQKRVHVWWMKTSIACLSFMEWVS